MTSKSGPSPFNALGSPQYLTQFEEKELENMLARLTQVNEIAQSFINRRGQATSSLIAKISAETNHNGLDIFFSSTGGKVNNWHQKLDLEMVPIHVIAKDRTALEDFHLQVKNSNIKRTPTASLVEKNDSTNLNGVSRKSLTYTWLNTKYAELLTNLQSTLCDQILTAASPTKDIEKMENIIVNTFAAASALVAYAGGFAIATVPTTLKFALGVSIGLGETAFGAGVNTLAGQYRADVICDINQTIEALTKVLAPNDARNVFSILKDPTYDTPTRIQQCKFEIQRAIDDLYDKADKVIQAAKIKRLEEQGKKQNNENRQQNNEIRQQNNEIRQIKEDHKKMMEILKKQSDMTQKIRQDSMRNINKWVRDYV